MGDGTGIEWTSCEPLIGPVNLESSLGGTRWIGGQRGCGGTHRGVGSKDCPREPHHHHDDRCLPGVDWVIAGGESGREARTMHVQWARQLRDQCASAAVPFFFKQWGEWMPRVRGEGEGTFDTLAQHDRDRLVDLHGDVHCTREAAGIHAVPMSRVGKRLAGSLLDGQVHKAMPR